MYKGNSLKSVTLNTLGTFSKDEKLQECFISADDSISTPDEIGMNQEGNKEKQQFYNNKEIIDFTGVGKDEMDEKSLPVNYRLSGELPFLSGNGKDSDFQNRDHVLSPHADTLDIGDLDDIESVKSEQSE